MEDKKEEEKKDIEAKKDKVIKNESFILWENANSKVE